MPLPRLPYGLGAKQNVTIAIRGLNWTNNYPEGAMEDTLHLTAVDYPYFSTKPARVLADEIPANANVTNLYAWDDLIYVDGRDDHLYYRDNGTYVDCGSVGEGEHQFAMVGRKLVVWGAGAYLDLDDLNGGLHNLEAADFATGVTIYTTTVDGLDYIGFTYDTTYMNFQDIKVEDVIEIHGFLTETNNGFHKIEKKLVSATAPVLGDPSPTVYHVTLLFAPDTLTIEAQPCDIWFERKIPSMDYVCESNNRLWGCSSDARTIYCSRLGDPTNFYDYSGEADDSFALEITTPGPFTGCAKLGSSVLFFKEQYLHKIIGAYNAEYQMTTYTMPGIAEGSAKSAVVINEVLYYLSTDGVYAYNGGTPTLISAELGEKRLSNGVGGTDGTNYYLSVNDGENSLFLTYFARYGFWLKEDNAVAINMVRLGDELYVLIDGDEDADVPNKVYKERGSDATESVDFLIQFKPLYETVTGSYNRSSVAFGQKRYGKVILRTEMKPGTWAAFDIREDGGVWREVQKLVGETGLSRVVLPIGRTDKYEIRIRGNGKFTLKNMVREFRIGSDK